jgi:hypothetical protein
MISQRLDNHMSFKNSLHSNGYQNGFETKAICSSISDSVAVKEAVEACDSVTGHNHLFVGWTDRLFSKLEMAMDRLGPQH